MRVILFILIIAVAGLLIAIGTGFMSIRPTSSSEQAKTGTSSKDLPINVSQTPTFDIETGSVAVGTRRKTMTVPVLKVVPPGQQANTVNNAG